MPPKPRIAILADFPLFVASPSFQREGWHYATWLAGMYEMLSQADKYDIHWVTFSKQIHGKADFASAGQHFHVLPAFSLKYAQKTAYWHARWQVRRLLKNIRPDLVHAWGTEQRYAVSAMGYQGKKVLSVQGHLNAYIERAWLPPFLCRQAKWEKAALSAYDMLTGESPWSVERIREMVPHLPVRQFEYCVEKRFFEIKRDLFEHPVCLMSGSATPIKNVETAISAFSSPELRGVELLLAGVPAGHYSGLPSNIKPLGGVNREKMAELMSRAWCLVHPSLAETGPTVVKEARVIGMPVIISEETGSKQYVEYGKSGFVLQPRDVPGFIRSVQTVTASRETALAMGEYGHAECRRLLSHETMFENLMALYEEMLRA